MLWLRVTLLVCIQLYFLDQAMGCRCPYYLHSQNAFCDPAMDFVMKAQVKKKITKGTEITIKLKKRRVFKKSPAFIALPKKAKKKVFTLVGSSACEANMDVGKTYVFTGKVGSGKLWVSSCGYIRLWKDLNNFERKNFRVKYKRNCDCDITQVGGARPPFTFSPRTCVLISTFVSPCGQYAYCACSDPSCSTCSLQTQQPEWSDCIAKQPLPP